MKPRWIYYALALSLAAFLLLSWAGNRYALADVDPDQDEVRLRLMGHEILKVIGDDSSRILPLRRLKGTEYILGFERVFSFVPDSIVRVVRQHLEGVSFSRAYLFQVLDCGTSDIVYSFSVDPRDHQPVIPCEGRAAPEACYQMRVVFKEPPAAFKWYGFLLFPLFISAGYFLQKRTNKPSGPAAHKPAEEQHTRSSPVVFLGRFRFNPSDQTLFFEEDGIPLSAKESELLAQFAQAPNQLIPRDQLMKTIWEDQGIIVGRSLDVFVSRLRKKLSVDPEVKLIGVHGKGYKLLIPVEQA
ncbi:MAG TPA: winged helix-turn-helix domain-containing protein [Saprospiraceae bacterium]|nr:winged helix-turn-helix domain-containing protein [Saprospiraceae bacterium]